jgi:hypothetical protein
LHDDKIYFASQTIELSETKTYLELTNRLCYYDEANLNGVILPSEGAQEKADTLIGMPVVAKYRKDADGKPNFGGHELYVNPVTGAVTFGTENVGTHLSVEIKDDTVDVGGVLKTLPCLFAVSRIWTRNKNVIAAVKRLFNEKRLFTSWELVSSAYEFKDGIKILKDYVFEANALLGTNNPPAYGTAAATLNVASLEPEIVIAEALANDIAERAQDEESDKVKKETETQVIAGGVESTPVVDPEINKTEQQAGVTPVEHVTPADTSEEAGAPETPSEETEVASLTIQDLHQKLCEAVRAKLDGWNYIAWLFPEDHIIWVQGDSTKEELECIEMSYSVGEDGVITLGEPVRITLIGSPRVMAEKLVQTSEALIKANESVAALTAQVETLNGYKEVFDKAEAARIAAEAETKKSEISAMLLKGGYIKKEELAEIEQLKQIVATLNFDAAKIYLADRMIASEDNSTESAIETTSTHAPVIAAQVQEELPINGVANVRGWLGKKN